MATASKDRILGQSVTLSVTVTQGPSAGTHIQVGDIDSVDVTDNAKMLQHQPLGTSSPIPQLAPAGYTLACKGGKVDWQLSNLIAARDVALKATTVANASLNPQFTVHITTIYFDGTTEVESYTHGVIYGYKKSVSKSDAEVTEDFTFECAVRTVVGPAGSTAANFGTATGSPLKTGLGF